MQKNKNRGFKYQYIITCAKELIRALATGGSMTHIPFGGSKLTQLLKEIFVVENLRIVMVAWGVHEWQIAITFLIYYVILIE